MSEDLLLTPLKLANGTSLNNRLVLSPMVTNSSTSEGLVSPDDLRYAQRRSHSAPLQITGAAYINTYGQLFEYGFSAAKDADIDGLGRLAHSMKAQGAKAILQLTHAGRFSSHTLNRYGFVYGPSAMKLNAPQPHTVHALTTAEIQAIIDDYAQATRRAIRAGFDGVEISSAQRLLIQTFFSTFSNLRDDSYGCRNLRDRSRIGLEVLTAVTSTAAQEAPNDFIIGFRGTPEETRGSDIGYSIEEFMQFTEWALDIAPLDYLAIASWGRDVFRNRVRGPGNHCGQLVNHVIHQHFTQRLPIMATGGINSPEKAREALRHADFVGLSTPFLVDPEFVQKIQAGRESEITTHICPSNLSNLAIPEASFKDIVPFMDYGESLPADTREVFRGLASNYSPKVE